jgi:hypothetical protein
MPSHEADRGSGNNLQPSVSNPPSPFVDMASGVQSTAANERNQPCPLLPPPSIQLSSAVHPG